MGPMGSHWVQKIGSKRRTLPCPKFEFSTTPRSSIFPKTWKLWLWRQITVGTPRVHLRAKGVPLGKKNLSKRRKLPCTEFRIFDDPTVIHFSPKMEVTVMAPNRGGDPVGSIFGPMGSYWVQKMGQNHKKLPCPKIWIFDYTAVIDFSEKMKITVMAPNHGGDPLG